MLYPYGFFYDPTYFLVLIGVVLSLVASGRVKSTFQRFSKMRSMSGMTGAETAKKLLHSQGIYDVSVIAVAGDLTDHYDPGKKVLALSEPVYHSTSVAAIGVAAHECGHAVQHQNSYLPLQIRGALVPVVNISSTISWPLIGIGMLIGGAGSTLIQVGILLFSMAVLFQLVTLPVEFNASRRAVVLLEQLGILSGNEVQSTKKVLNAAALTYVAALAASVLQLLRLVLLFGGRNRD